MTSRLRSPPRRRGATPEPPRAKLDIHADVTFSVCALGGASIAVFVDRPLPEARRAAIVAAKPDRLGAIVFAAIHAASEPSRALIDVDVADTGTLRTSAVAFAVAVVVEDRGAFEFQPAMYLVRFSGGAAVRVTLTFDWDTESWSGDATPTSPVSPAETRDARSRGRTAFPPVS